ncbi:MAG TPA: nucleotidyltransferase family protein [Burkholderiaceae bacterium]|nr:nucleotidyltransferase family protein [Burkholderiaceae bacterium]
MRGAVDALLLALLAPDDEPLPSVSAPTWAALPREAVRHGVAPLVHARLQRQPPQDVPACVRQALQVCQLRTGLENLRLLATVATLLRQWQSVGIDVIVLKGAYLAQAVYAQPALRSMGDADLLVRPADLDRAREVLRANGWREDTASAETTLGGGGHQLPRFMLGGVTVELHWAIEDEDSPFTIDGDGLWRRAAPALVGGAPTLALAPEDLLLHLALHCAYGHGWMQFESGLRPLADIAACLRKFGDQIDWWVVTERAHAWRVHPSVWLTLTLVRDLLHVGAPDAALDRLAPPHADRALVDAAVDLLLGHHYRDLAAQLPVLSRSWLTKRWHRLPRAAHWRAHALPDATALSNAYPSARRAPLAALRFAAHWVDLLSDVVRMSIRREARALAAREHRRARLLQWLERAG